MRMSLYARGCIAVVRIVVLSATVSTASRTMPTVLLLALVCTSCLLVVSEGNLKEALPRAVLTDALRTLLQREGQGARDEYSFAADEAAMRCAGRPEERSHAYAFHCALLRRTLALASMVSTACPSPSKPDATFAASTSVRIRPAYPVQPRQLPQLHCLARSGCPPTRSRI